RGTRAGSSPSPERVQGRTRPAGDHPGADDPRERRPEVSGYIGQDVPRVDGPAKVTGAAHYSGEIWLPGLAYAEIVSATIPSGRISSIETAAAEHADGVVTV